MPYIPLTTEEFRSECKSKFWSENQPALREYILSNKNCILFFSTLGYKAKK